MKRRNSDTSKGIENFGTRHASKGMEALSGSLGSYIEFLSEGSAREAPTLLGYISMSTTITKIKQHILASYQTTLPYTQEDITSKTRPLSSCTCPPSLSELSLRISTTAINIISTMGAQKRTWRCERKQTNQRRP